MPRRAGITTLHPPKWTAGFANRLSPAMWKSGRKTRLTIPGRSPKNSSWFMTFQKTIPWVSIAPFGCPLVPEVYMISNTSSWST